MKVGSNDGAEEGGKRSIPTISPEENEATMVAPRAEEKKACVAGGKAKALQLDRSRTREENSATLTSSQEASGRRYKRALNVRLPSPRQSLGPHEARVLWLGRKPYVKGLFPVRLFFWLSTLPDVVFR